MPPKTPNVTVIIVAHNSAQFLPRCLDSLAAQTYKDFDVILIDNASTDGSTDGLAEKFLRFPPSRRAPFIQYRLCRCQ